MAKEYEQCPYMVKMYEVPICSLNSCPCEKISNGVCERIYETIMPQGGAGVVGEEDTDECI